MNAVFQTCLWIVIALFPLYFWGYALSLTGEGAGDIREKFWAWVVAGVVSVGGIFLLSRLFPAPSVGEFLWFFGLFISGWILLGLVVTRLGSPYSRGFIRRSASIHLVLMTLLFALILAVVSWWTGDVLLGGILVSLFLPAFFEEMAKHFGMLGLLGRSFSFSLRDIAIFTFCTVLGFVCIENILYAWMGQGGMAVSILRSLWVFSVHLAAAMICTIAWWKALSYPFFSRGYMLYFFLWLTLAVVLHTIFNYFALTAQLWIFFPYGAAAYGLFTFAVKK